MKLTNKTGLPNNLVVLAEWLLNSHPKFENNRFSVTELLKSEQQIVLQRRFDDEIVIDVQDTFPLWEGTAIHSLLEQFTSKDDYIAEERLEMEIAPDIFISGAFDCLNKNTWELIDYKNTKIPSVQDALQGKDDKWLNQMYFYALLIESKYRKRPQKATIVGMCKDHSKVKASTTTGYQQYPIQQVVFDLMDSERATQMVEEYSTKAKRLKEVLDKNLEPSPCTYGDMWCKEDYAIMKIGGSRAIPNGVFDNADEAYAKWASLTNPEQYRIYHRVSNPTNCQLYCNCRDICPQWQKFKNDDISLTEDVTEKIIPF